METGVAHVQDDRDVVPLLPISHSAASPAQIPPSASRAQSAGDVQEEERPHFLSLWPPMSREASQKLPSATEYSAGSYHRLPDISTSYHNAPANETSHFPHGDPAISYGNAFETAHDPFLTGVDLAGSGGTAKRRYSFLDIAAAWWLELWSFFLCFAMIFAIVGTTYPNDGRPLPQWPFNLSINALVSAFIVVFKTSLALIVAEGLGQLKWLWFSESRPLRDLQTYDDASRGPLGAIRLIFTLRGRHIASTIAAAVVLILLIVDPLSQLLIRYKPCQSVDLDRNATVPRSNFYARTGSAHLGANIYSIESGMQAAINIGVFDPESNQINYNCPTGNCTFDGDFKTIGYCSTCADVSDQLNITTESVMPMNYSLPSGLTATPGMRTFVMDGGLGAGVEAIYAFLADNDSCAADPNSWTCKGYGAAQCNFTQCVRTFSSSVRGGNLTEQRGTIEANEDDQWNMGPGDNTINTIDLTCAGNGLTDSFKKAGYNIEDGTKWLAWNATNTTDISVPDDCLYKFNIASMFSLGTFLGSFFQGEVVYAPKALGGSSVLQHIFAEGNISLARIEETFENVTFAMTKYMRQNGVANYSQPFVGQVLKNETCVDVKWAWLILPSVLVFLVMCFFIFMILETTKMEGGGRFYKSSLLPLMFHPLETPSQRQAAFMTESKRMDDEADRLKFKLVESNDRGLRFVHTTY